MPVVPDKKNEQIQFAEQHAPVWAVTPTAIGLTAAGVTAIATATTNARKSYDAALAARLASKAATTQADNDIQTMLTLIGDAVKQIRLYAESTHNPNVFAKAEIPPPAAPTPAMPPTQPIELRAVIESMGQLTVQWKCAASTPGLDDSTGGVLYTIRRRLHGQTGFTYVGTAKPSRAGKRGFSTFTDTELPANPSGLQYVVQGVRSTGGGNLTGPASDVFSVTLGVGGDGSVFVADTQSMKLAA